MLTVHFFALQKRALHRGRDKCTVTVTQVTAPIFGDDRRNLQAGAQD